jgi:hypothetical protein
MNEAKIQALLNFIDSKIKYEFSKSKNHIRTVPQSDHDAFRDSLETLRTALKLPNLNG